MVLGIKKYLEAILLPAAMLIIVDSISLLASPFVPTKALGTQLEILIMLVDFAIVIWAGYRAVKKLGMGVKEATLSTALAGAIATFVVGCEATAVIQPPKVMAILNNSPSVLTIIGFVIGIVIGTAIFSIILAIPSAILGAVGAIIPSRAKEPAPDTWKCLKAALLPATVLVVLGIVLRLGLYFFAVASGMALLIALLFILVELAVFAWTGHQAAKKGMGVSGGAVTAAIAAAVVGLISIIGNLVFPMLGIQALFTSYIPDFSSAAGVAFFAFRSMNEVVLLILLGGVLGVIGAYVASRETRPRPVHPAPTSLLSKKEIGKES